LFFVLCSEILCATARKTGPQRPILHATQTLRFADFSLDLQRRQLTRGGKRVDLSPGLVAILGYLASHPGTVFAKDALFDRFWPCVVVSENTLERSVSRIRNALGDSIKDPKFIQNLARRGYCFIARVERDNMPLTGDALDKWVVGRPVLESLDAERLDEAVRAFEEVLAANPEDHEANAGVANGYFLQFERTRADTPDWPLLERAIVHAREACLLKAESILTETIQTRVADGDIHSPLELRASR
jgi:DNA-binding winged helix-turn-helix (wHTH) protein